MVCAWQGLLNILPIWMRPSVDKLGRDDLQEIRLRLEQPPFLRFKDKDIWLERKTIAADLHFCINTASKYSPWLAETADSGYITAPGGHRIGICGSIRGTAGSITNLSSLTSLCIRVARDFPGLASNVPQNAESILIIGRPGSGKTTLLRDLIRQRSDTYKQCVAVVDERAEIFPRINGSFCFSTGKHTDILTGCTKTQGIISVLRAMGPDIIAIDEITADEDCQALYHAGWCGVRLIATAHAGDINDLYSRPLYRPLIESKVFDTVIILRTDKTWHWERLNI